MTDPGKKADVEAILTEFDRKKEVLARLCETTKGLIEKCLQGANIRFQSVQARVKGREKIRTKYLDPKKNYSRLDDVTDQAALRVITYYEDEVDRAAEVIKAEFEIDSKNSVDKRDVDPEKFGYYALNYVCRYSKARTSHIEYKEFGGIPCEIQITSILRHAWSEIEHPWYDLKDAFPDNIKRRFARMAALLEIAESEFLSLRKIQSDYTRSLDVQVAAKFSDIPIDAASIRPFIEQEPVVAELDRAITALAGRALSDNISGSQAEFKAKFARLAGMTTLADIRDSLQKHGPQVIEYVKECARSVWEKPTGGPIEKGVSIVHLAMVLLSERGEMAVNKAVGELKITPPAGYVARQVAVAKEIAAKQAR